MGLPDLPGSSLLDGLFGTGLSQHARLITLASAQDSTLPDALLPERFTGREAVNELFRFDIDALSTSTDLELNSFIGEEITLKLLQADGTRRAWHGICTDAAWLGADGGMARYRLRLEPGLSLLGLRRDSYIFQDKNAQDLITELLADYTQVRFEFDVTQELAVRPIWTQYRESDLEFLQRVLAAEGLSWRFEHDQDEQEGSAEPEGGQKQAKHKVVFFDSKAVAPETVGGAELRFHGVRATDSDDAIDEFNALRRIQANAVTISSWDPTQLVAPAAEQTTSLDIGELPALAIYDGSAERRHADTAAADPHSRLMLQALELDNKLFEGQGAVRRMAAGHGFQLTQHENYADGANQFTALWVEHEARNNIEPALGGLSKLVGAAKAGLATLAKFAGSQLEAGTYRNRFACVRDTVAIVPRASAERFSGAALGPQTALVVGLPDAVNTTTREHQVRIQFAWQRGASANPGGLAHNTDDKGNAPGNDASGTWVRVAEALAGPNWGSQFTPRIGTEVLVDFIEGDMDRPLVVAQLYTGADTPPYAAGVDSGVNHAGVISGMHSNNFDGGGYNQWVVDDTPGQLRTRLATSSAATQLNLGYLVHQGAGSAERGSYRGHGFELRTDAWGVLRSGEGMLISATARAQQGAGVTSTQLDSAEATGLLRAASELSKNLADAATQQTALVSKDANQAQIDFITQIDPEQKGKFEGSVGGHDPLKAKAGARDLDSAAPVEKFGQPVVLMEAPASINWATPASTVLFAGGQLQWTTQADMHMAAGFTVASVSANATGLFTHAGGIQAIAANGPVSLQAHTDQLEILADKAITVISVNDVIEIKANQKIVLQAGQSSVTLEGGNITFACPGNFTVKGGQHVFDGGASGDTTLAKLPDSRLKLFDEAFILKNKDTGAPIPGQPYRIKRADGSFESGITDANGHTHLVSSAEPESVEVQFTAANVQLETPDQPIFDEQIEFKNANNAPLKNLKYLLVLEDDSIVEGVTDDFGLTERIVTSQPLGVVEARLKPISSANCCAAHAEGDSDSVAVPLNEIKTNSTDIGVSVVTVGTQKGQSRPMTTGEIDMAKIIFADSIDYSQVRIHKGEYLWFGLQPDDTAMTPNGEMYFNPDRFVEDFSLGQFFEKIWFMHEMVHVWQYQLGYWVKARGAIRLGLSYKYTLSEDKQLSDYNMEAQGNILADYWAFKYTGGKPIQVMEEKYLHGSPLYEKVLANFIANPADKKNLP